MAFRGDGRGDKNLLGRRLTKFREGMFGPIDRRQPMRRTSPRQIVAARRRGHGDASRQPAADRRRPVCVARSRTGAGGRAPPPTLVSTACDCPESVRPRDASRRCGRDSAASNALQRFQKCSNFRDFRSHRLTRRHGVSAGRACQIKSLAGSAERPVRIPSGFAEKTAGARAWRRPEHRADGAQPMKVRPSRKRASRPGWASGWTARSSE